MTVLLVLRAVGARNRWVIGRKVVGQFDLELAQVDRYHRLKVRQ